MGSPLRFSIYGQRVDIERVGSSWRVLSVGPDGQRSPARFVVPDFIEQQELVQYLEDLFHENAMPHNGDVRQIER